MSFLKIFYENFYQDLRNILYSYKNKNFPFGLKIQASKNQYLQIFDEAKKIKYKNIEEYEKNSGYKIDLDWLDNLALHTQIVIKKSTILAISFE